VSGHDHGHSPAVGRVHRRALRLVLVIAAAVLLTEVVGALVSHSLALLADAGHLLTDVAGLSLALVATVLAERPATAAHTWGYRRAEVLAAAAQAVVLLGVGIYVLVEGVIRLVHPPAVMSGAMIVFGIIGLLGNAVSIGLLTRIRADSLNTRAAFLEVVNDALGSLAVIVAGTIIGVTGWLRADALASLLIGALILPRTAKLLRETLNVLLESTPRGVDLAEVRQHLLGVPHVRDVHDLHASIVSSDLPVLTAHVVLDDLCFHDGHAPAVLDQLQRCLAGHFDVEHSTFQLEPRGHLEHEHLTHA
jgi:cobalt-zinc-cadmium efflux system protein